MKKKYLPIVILLMTLILAAFGPAPGQGEEPPVGDVHREDQGPLKEPESTAMFKGKVTEVIDGGRYVYLKIDTGDKQVWVATPSFNGKTGDAVLVPPGDPIADFHSKKLNRVFKCIYFVGSVRLGLHP